MVEAQVKYGRQKLNIYRIRLKGGIAGFIVDWFDGLSILPQENGDTVLVGQISDQAALRGLLEQLWNLNYTVLAVELIETREETKP